VNDLVVDKINTIMIKENEAIQIDNRFQGSALSKLLDTKDNDL